MALQDEQPDDGEHLDVGRRHRRPGPVPPFGGRWVPWLLVAVVAAGVIVVLTHHRGATHQGGLPPPATAVSTAARTPPTSAPPRPSVSVVHIGRLLGVTAGWELFGRGADAVVRIQPARGRLTLSTVPQLASDGPVSFLAVPGQAIVRPLDHVAGYAIPDGGAARPLAAGLPDNGPIFAGPTPDQVWVNPGGTATMVLRSVSGQPVPARSRIAVPADTAAQAAMPDGAGYLLLPTNGGVYDARPTGLRRVVTGTVVAVGPTGWLATTCDAKPDCHTVLIDRTTLATRRLPATVSLDGPVGAIAPDGRTAAIFERGPSGASRLVLLDLTSGRQQAVTISVGKSIDSTDIVWAPDSSHLFAVDADGRLRVVEPRTAQVTDLGVGLPTLSQLAIRN